MTGRHGPSKEADVAPRRMDSSALEAKPSASAKPESQKKEKKEGQNSEEQKTNKQNGNKYYIKHKTTHKQHYAKRANNITIKLNKAKELSPHERREASANKGGLRLWRETTTSFNTFTKNSANQDSKAVHLHTHIASVGPSPNETVPRRRRLLLCIPLVNGHKRLL